ncbi:VOC family protein [Actinoplanes sp. NPDC051494]|uniref:VOC family protein n=1 Tax=Actinoplanes sp. NPDC051494 TaxID=3363907 RepID=UPI00379B642B
MTHPMPGVPNWVDLGTSDLQDAIRFYTQLFGWEAEISGAEYGGYTTFRIDGRATAGAGPTFGEGQPTAWSTYIATDDADAVTARVAAAGGKVLVPPFDVMYQGRMAAFLDQAGAPFSVWQAGTMKGADIFDVPGALTWNELVTRDIEGSAAFYGDVFGWVARESSMGDLPYIIWEYAGETIAGMQQMDATWPHDLPPHWMISFAVADCDDAAGYAQSLGGRVLQSPSDLAIGRHAVLEDPQGGAFAVLQNDQQ